MRAPSIFTGKTLLITGGTGSFGQTVLKHFLNSELAEVRIFQPRRKKQDDMRHELQQRKPDLAGKVKFYIGDVREMRSVQSAVKARTIFFMRQRKQVPSCEFFQWKQCAPMCSGTDNVLTAAIEAGGKKVVCLSTDKAAYPINSMGISKAMMEKGDPGQGPERCQRNKRRSVVPVMEM